MLVNENATSENFLQHIRLYWPACLRLAGAHLFTANSQLARTLAWLDSEIKVTRNFGVFLKQTNTVAFLVIKDDVLLYEGYFNGHDHNATVTSFSVAKSFVSAPVGIAISDEYITYISNNVQDRPDYRYQRSVQSKPFKA
jgi:hypothetical protein